MITKYICKCNQVFTEDKVLYIPIAEGNNETYKLCCPKCKLNGYITILNNSEMDKK